MIASSTPDLVRPDAKGRSSYAFPAIALLAVLVALAVDRGPIAGVVVLFVLVVPFERRFPRHRQAIRRPEIGTDVAYALLSAAFNAVGLTVGIAVGVASLAWVPGLLLRPIVSAMPAIPRTVVGIALFDMFVYWAHRFGHEVPFFWRFHVVHHSTERLDWISGFRTHPLDGAFFAPRSSCCWRRGFRSN